MGADLRKQFGDKVVKGIQPEVSFDTIPKPICVPNRADFGIFVCQIPTSERRPHMIRPESIFYRRSDGGTAVEMDFYEVRDQMLLMEERLKKIRLLQLEIATFKEQISSMGLDANLWHIAERFDISGFRPLLAEVAPLVDFEMLTRLQKVATLANRANQALELERLQFQQAVPSASRHFQDAISELKPLCMQVEAELLQRFDSPWATR